MLTFIIGVIAGAVVGYIFRAQIGKQVERTNAQLQEEVNKLKSQVK